MYENKNINYSFSVTEAEDASIAKVQVTKQ